MKRNRHILVKYDTGSFDGIVISVDSQSMRVREAYKSKRRSRWEGTLKPNERGDYWVDVDEQSSAFVSARDVMKILEEGEPNGKP